MDTLILLEDDKEHLDTCKEDQIKSPKGFTAVDKISGKLQWFDDKSKAALDDPDGQLAAAYFCKILRKIVNFADKCMADERKKPASEQADVEEIQIVLEFHQTSARLAAAITKAFTDLPNDKAWLGLPKKHNLSVRIRRVWVLSCESGGHYAKNAGVASKCATQAKDMETAIANGAKTDRAYPPENPPKFWTPYVYTFSTGDIVTGSTTLDPNAVQFKATPYWQATPDGNVELTQQGRDFYAAHHAEYAVASGGTIYQYNGETGAVVTAAVPETGFVDILNNPFGDK